jgi:hypothetical protein
VPNERKYQTELLSETRMCVFLEYEGAKYYDEAIAAKHRGWHRRPVNVGASKRVSPRVS